LSIAHRTLTVTYSIGIERHFSQHPDVLEGSNEIMGGMCQSSACQRCEGMPAAIDGAGTLYLWFPLGHSLGKGLLSLQRAEARYQPVGDKQCVLVRLNAGDIEGVVAGLMAAFSGEEARDTKTLFLARREEPQLADFAQVMPLQQLSTLLQSSWLIDILEQERVTSFFQPIVLATDPSHIFAHEALLRGIDGNGALMSPKPMFDLARDASLLFQLDRVARLSAIRTAGRLGIGSHIFVNFNPSSVYDPAFCLRSTVQAIDEFGIDRDRVVFEVVESDSYSDLDHLRSTLDYYRNAGFRIALDDFGVGFSSFGLVGQLKPDFIKLDMSLIHNVHIDPVKAVIANNILETANQLGIETVAEGVEVQEELDWARDHRATFVQGYFIARPTDTPIPSVETAKF
jgi:EAL domain-containing protein (putative c-di-GMP-specific phosphodiesterase class I)